jgi:hypothetical protein
MHWKEKVRILEQHDDFDVAIFYLEQIIKEHPDHVDAYIFLLFRLMDTIVEHACHFANVSKTPVSDIKKKYYDKKEDCYEVLAQKYFKEGYAKFSENADFLFYVGLTAVMSEWYFGIDREDYEKMLDKARMLDPDNLIYNYPYYRDLDQATENNKKKIAEYANMILDEKAPIRKALADKGAVGEYWLEMRTTWSKRLLGLPIS